MRTILYENVTISFCNRISFHVSSGHLEHQIACGGMDNMCTVYDVNGRDANGSAKIVRELAGYEGFLSSCRFLDDTHIVTGSGDMKLMIWDLEAGRKTAEMDGHNGDIVCFVLNHITFESPRIWY